MESDFGVVYKKSLLNQRSIWCYGSFIFLHFIFKSMIHTALILWECKICLDCVCVCVCPVVLALCVERTTALHLRSLVKAQLNLSAQVYYGLCILFHWSNTLSWLMLLYSKSSGQVMSALQLYSSSVFSCLFQVFFLYI